jgi:hypothetical protein
MSFKRVVPASLATWCFGWLVAMTAGITIAFETNNTVALSRSAEPAKMLTYHSGESAHESIPTTVSPSFDFAISLSDNKLTLDEDPLIIGDAGLAEATIIVNVSLFNSPSEEVTLSLKGAPPGLKVSFDPVVGKAPFKSGLTLSIQSTDLAGPGSYNMTLSGTGGGLYRETTLRVDVARTFYGNLTVTDALAVQVVEGAASGYATLAKFKATAFKVYVNSTFTKEVKAYFRLTLRADQWTALRVILPLSEHAAKAPDALAAAPEQSLLYQEIWGPVPIPPGNKNVVYLPYIPPGHERSLYDPATEPAGLLQPRCFIYPDIDCTLPSRYAPRPTANSVNAVVAVDPENRIIESNEGDNVLASGMQNVASTRPWKFLFIPYSETGSPCLPDSTTVRNGARDQLEYLLATFPIADNKISYSISNVSTTWQSDSSQPGYEDRAAFLTKILRMAVEGGFDFGVGIGCGCGGGAQGSSIRAAFVGACPGEGRAILAHEFNHVLTGMGDIYSLDAMVAWDEYYCQLPDGTRRYCAYANSPVPAGTRGKFCVQSDRWTPPTCPSEQNKTLLISCNCSPGYANGNPPRPCAAAAPRWSPNDCRNNCQTACIALGGTVFKGPDGRTAHPAGDGFWVNKWVPTTRWMNYMMDSGWPDTGFPYFWQSPLNTYSHAQATVFNDGWANLTRSSNFLRANDPEILLVSGEIAAAGAVTFDAFLQLSAGMPNLEEGAKGEYRLRLVDGLGQVLQETGFDLTFDQPDPYGGPLDRIKFAFTIPWLRGTKKIVLLKGAETLATRLVTDNPPSVEVTGPKSGEAYSIGQSVPVSWTAHDNDGDVLTYSVMYSPDDGITWLPAATALSATNYELPTDLLPAGASYRVKVTATDGVNTAFSISSWSFSLQGTTTTTQSSTSTTVTTTVTSTSITTTSGITSSTTTTSSSSTTSTTGSSSSTTTSTLPGYGPSTLLEFPQIAVGGGYRGYLQIENPNSLSAQIGVSFRDPLGKSLALLINGSLQSSPSFSLPAQGSIKLPLEDTGIQAKTGWCQVFADRPISGVLVYQLLSGSDLVSEASVLSSPRSKKFSLLISQLGSSTETGLALANPDEQPASIVLRRMASDGQIKAETGFSLGSGEQTARFISQYFANGLAAQEGRVEILSSRPIIGVGLIYQGTIFATLPVIPLP